MKKRGKSIFFKVFNYTTIFIILLVCITVALFSRQFASFYSTAQIQQLNYSYQNLYAQLHGKSAGEVVEIAQSFSDNNQSFSFYIKDNNDVILFATPDIEPDIVPDSNNFRIIMTIDQQYILCAINLGAAGTDYGRLIPRTILALACMLALGVAGAFIFAGQMTKPIRRLAEDTKKMASLALEDAAPTPWRQDELGDLARDVHIMYERLKDTISQLEDEVQRQREMEEAQRYFFLAASHELKTPVAAVGVLLEGMLENVGDYRDHHKYLRECIRLMGTQNKLINEILEIVNLDDEKKIAPKTEKIFLAATVRALALSFETLARANGLGFCVDIPEDQTCLADIAMLKKALSNVILNAVQNTPEGGEIRIWSEPIADQYRLCILNTGARIEDVALAKLFDPFYRADRARGRKNRKSSYSGINGNNGNSGTSNISGNRSISGNSGNSGNSGLGLTIVKRALDAMQMEFSLTNAAEGVLFWVDIPEI